MKRIVDVTGIGFLISYHTTDYKFPSAPSVIKMTVESIRNYGTKDVKEIPLDDIALLGIFCYDDTKHKRNLYKAKAPHAMVLALSKILKLPPGRGTPGPSRPTYDLGDTNHTLEEEKAVCVMLAALADLAIEDGNCVDMEDEFFDFFIKFLFRTQNLKYRTILLKLFSEFLWSIEGRGMMIGYRVLEFFFEHGLSNNLVDVWLAEIGPDGPYITKVPCHPIAMSSKGITCVYRLGPHRSRLINMGIKERLEELQEVVTDKRAKKEFRIYDSWHAFKSMCEESDYCYHCNKGGRSSGMFKTGGKDSPLRLQFCSGCRVAVYCSRFSF